MPTVNEMLSEIKVAAELEVIKVQSIMEANVIELKASEDKGFDMGLAQAGIPATDKIYTEADLQAELSPLKDQIAALQVKIDGFAQSLVDAKAAGAAEMEAQLVAEMEAAQVDNSAIIAAHKKA